MQQQPSTATMGAYINSEFCCDDDDVCPSAATLILTLEGAKVGCESPNTVTTASELTLTAM